jgi:hypothetical protein
MARSFPLRHRPLIPEAYLADVLGKLVDNWPKYKRYRQAARHMLECRALDPNIEEYAAFEIHDAFVNRICAKHSRKTGFWSHVAEFTASAGARPHI